MNFHRFVGPVLFATCMADWLSIVKGVGLDDCMFMSLSMRLIQIVY